MKTQTERGIRFDISCEVCRDLMPLVRDGVASADSEALVRVHTERCGGCRTMLESETPPEHSMPDDARVLRRLRWRLLAQSVLFALVGVLGALWPGATCLAPLGTIFINLMFCIVVPLVFCSLSSSIACMKSPKRAGRIMGTTLLVFIVTGLIAAVIMLFAMRLYPPVLEPWADAAAGAVD